LLFNLSGIANEPERSLVWKALQSHPKLDQQSLRAPAPSQEVVVVVAAVAVALDAFCTVQALCQYSSSLSLSLSR
jgi:hypothetical protein